MAKEPKDLWDILDVLNKFLGTVVLIAIPIVIKYGADSIAQSLERGKLVQSLIIDLTEQKAQSRRDIALVALDAAIPPKEKCTVLWLWGCKTIPDQDQVADVALILLNDLAQGLSQPGKPLLISDTAKQILIRRTSEEYYNDKFYNKIVRNAQTQATSSVNPNNPSPDEAKRQAQASEIIRNIQPSANLESIDQSLNGIRLIYIQYGNNKAKAEQLQKYLQDKGILVPGIERVQGINNNNIRYSNSGDQQVAEQLKANLEQNQNIRFAPPVDLSKAGYTVQAGQFEIWLKD